MIIQQTELRGVCVVQPQVFEDARGFFMEIFHEAKFAEQGLAVHFVQDNHSRSIRGTLRGLHFQEPKAQGKLVRVTAGAIWDVAVDIRRGSGTFGQWVGTDLTADNKQLLYVPPGFAHGFCVTSDTADVAYKCTEFYDPACERGVRWDDPDLAIAWPIRDPVLSDKDRTYPLLCDCADDLPTLA